jgi:hypothetical protein
MDKRKIYELNCNTEFIVWREGHAEWDEVFIKILKDSNIVGYVEVLVYIDEYCKQLHEDHQYPIIIPEYQLTEACTGGTGSSSHYCRLCGNFWSSDNEPNHTTFCALNNSVKEIYEINS